jgi:hypothetical protein
VTYGNGRFVAVGWGGGTVLTSTDGSTWTITNSGSPIGLNSIAFGNGIFVAVSVNDTILTSPDGSTWTKIYSGKGHILYSVTFGSGRFVVVGEETVLSSFDGLTWTVYPQKGLGIFRSVTYGDGQFVGVGNGGTIQTSKVDNLGAIRTNSHRATIAKAQVTVANNRVLISLPNATTAGQLRVEIFTADGKRTYLSNVRINNGILNIPTVGYPSGVYFMSIKEESRSTFLSAFVLRR